MACVQAPWAQPPGLDAPSGLELFAQEDAIAAKIARRREQELARRNALLFSQKRNGGVDHSVLDAQVAEKRAQAEALAAEEAEVASQQAYEKQVFEAIEKRKVTESRERHKNAIEYSLKHLNKESRREYDLNDPNALRNEKPPGIKGVPLGPSSFMNFGSDFDPKARKKQQQQAQKEWLQEQMREKENRRAAEREEKVQHDRDILVANAVRAACEDHEQKEARREKCEEAAENLKLAAEHRSRQEARKQREIQERLRHAAAVRADERIREAHDCRVNEIGRVTEYKRMSVEEEQGVYDAWAVQILEKRARKERDADEPGNYMNGILQGQAVLGQLEKERLRQQKEREREVIEYNKKLAAAKREADRQERFAQNRRVYGLPIRENHSGGNARTRTSSSAW